MLAGAAYGVAPASGAFAAEHRLSRQTLHEAADRLVDQGHLVREERRAARSTRCSPSGCGGVSLRCVTPDERRDLRIGAVAASLLACGALRLVVMADLRRSSWCPCLPPGCGSAAGGR